MLKERCHMNTGGTQESRAEGATETLNSSVRRREPGKIGPGPPWGAGKGRARWDQVNKTKETVTGGAGATKWGAGRRGKQSQKLML